MPQYCASKLVPAWLRSVPSPAALAVTYATTSIPSKPAAERPVRDRQSTSYSANISRRPKTTPQRRPHRLPRLTQSALHRLVWVPIGTPSPIWHVAIGGPVTQVQSISSSISLPPKRLNSDRPASMLMRPSTGDFSFVSIFEISDTASLTRLSVPDQKRIDAATPVTGLTHEQVERECGYVIGDRINRCIDPLMHDLQVAAAGFAGFRLDRCGIASDFLISDSLGRATQGAFNARLIPQRAAQRAGTKRCLAHRASQPPLTTPAHRRTRDRRLRQPAPKLFRRASRQAGRNEPAAPQRQTHVRPTPRSVSR